MKEKRFRLVQDDVGFWYMIPDKPLALFKWENVVALGFTKKPSWSKFVNPYSLSFARPGRAKS